MGIAPPRPRETQDPDDPLALNGPGLANYALALFPFFLLLLSPALSFFLIAGRANASLAPPAMAFHLP